MVRDLLKLVLLEEFHGCLLPVEKAESLFGSEIVDIFISKFPEFCINKGYLGRSELGNFLRKEKISERKLAFARRKLKILKILPWVFFAGVTGSVAFHNANYQDDIDVIMVCKKNRLWLTRALDFVLLRTLGVRRTYEERDLMDKICVNYYFSTNILDVRKHQSKDEFLTAVELAFVQPVVREENYEILLKSNHWIIKYFPELKKINENQLISRFTKRTPVISLFGDATDFVAMKLQTMYMHLKRHKYEQCNVSRNKAIFFNTSAWNKREKYLEKMLKRYDL